MNKLIPVGLIAAGAIVSLVGGGCSKPKTPTPVAPKAQPAATTTGAQKPSSNTTVQSVTIKPGLKPVVAKPTPAPAHATSVVSIKDFQFSPLVLAIKAGDTVVWKNTDSVVHQSKSDGAILWDSGAIQPGKSYSHVFPAPGSYTYACPVHPNMKATIIVR